MKKLINLRRVILITIALWLGFMAIVNAATLTLITTVNKESVTVGETITVTVNWNQGMQAADFILNYDAEKLDYISSDLGARATNKSGKIIVAWYSDDNTDKTKAEFSFKTKAEGTTEFSVKIDGGFADKNVVKPDAYDVTTYGKATLEIKAPDVEDETQNPETPSIEDDKEDETQNPETPSIEDDKEGETQNPETPSIEDDKEDETQNPETPSIEDDKEGETQNPEKPSTEDNKQNETNKKPTVIPHAGIGENLFVGIVALIIITTFAYIKMRIYKDI